MANQHQPRRKISLAVLIIIGLLIGFAIKKVALGLVIGLVIGLIGSGMIGKDKE